MASKNISSFRAEVDYYVKRASSDTTFLDRQIVSVIRDFCKMTWTWRVTLDPIDVVDGDGDYTLVIPDTDGQGELWMVDWVKYKEDGNDDDQYSFINPIVIENEEVNGITGVNAGYWNTSGNSPENFWVDQDDTLYLIPIPNANAAGTQNLQVKVIVIPILDTCTKVPVHIYNDWAETIGKGVAARILNMAAKKWYDPKLSMKYQAEYMKVRNSEARRQMWEGKNRSTTFIKIHPGTSGGYRFRGYYN